ncbi:hypothetical protein [Rheinheimera pleomorphica]|uniref:hypothetical protein n=1 Tax=Rheinheimera pleomorphica TaxID=2703963 RepID=UPI00141EA016|nr:hypothetical protein [Rheinheimera pleomorphica]
MDTSALQAGLSQLQHLLPSQREWLERLLFQLAFNDVRRIDVVAADGSGKSTLALALAELFSSQHNVALLSARIAPEQASAELMQQWFASSLRDDVSLAEQVAKAADTTPLLLVIDDAGRYPVELLQQLAALPCILCCFSDQSMADAGLTLTLNRVTAADAAQLLQHEALNSIELAERLARANNNLHLLLLPPRQVAGDDKTNASVPLLPVISGVLAVVLLVLAYNFWPVAQQAAQPPSAEHAAAVAEVTVATDTVAATDSDASGVAKPAGLTLAEQAPRSLDAPVSNNTNSDGDSTILESDTALSADSDKVADSNLLTAPVDTQPDAAEIAPSSPGQIEPADSDKNLYDEASLLQMDKSATAVQLAVLSSDAALKRFKKTYPDVVVLSYQRSWQGKMQLVLLQAPFDSVAAAKAAMAQLPAALRATGPFIKSMSAVQAEIRARQISLHSAPE